MYRQILRHSQKSGEERAAQPNNARSDGQVPFRGELAPALYDYSWPVLYGPVPYPCCSLRSLSRTDYLFWKSVLR